MATNERVFEALLRKNAGAATADDLVIIELFMKARRQPIQDTSRVGAVVMKEFDAGWFKGEVVEHDEFGYFVVYEDGDEEHVSLEELEEILYTPEPGTDLCDRIEWVETSGCKARSFAKMLREMVGERPYLAEQLAAIYMEMGDVDITDGGEFSYYDIAPRLWSYLGDDEVQKMHWAKRVMERLAELV